MNRGKKFWRRIKNVQIQWKTLKENDKDELITDRKMITKTLNQQFASLIKNALQKLIRLQNETQ